MVDVVFVDGPWKGKIARNANVPDSALFIRTKSNPDHLYILSNRVFASLPDDGTKTAVRRGEIILTGNASPRPKFLAQLRFTYIKEAECHDVTQR